MKPVKDFWKSLKKDVRDERGLRNTLRFMLVFSASFLVFILLVIPLTSSFWEGMGSFHAGAVQWVLSGWGIESQANGNILSMEVRGEGIDFLISQLCSGDIEIALLVSLLVASLDVLLIWRVFGGIVGIIFLLLMNPLRIAVTLAITKDSGMAAGDFYHGIIFRLFLFVVLVLYYFAWYRMFAKRKSSLQERLCKRMGL